MRIWLFTISAVLISVASGSTAFALPDLELVNGTDTLLVTDDGAVFCTTETCTAASVTDEDDALFDVNSITIANTVSIYLGNIVSPTVPVFDVTFSTPVQTGADAQQTAYAFVGGTRLAGPLDLVPQIAFTTSVGGVTFLTTGNIAEVPEPMAVTLFGTVVAVCATLLRRRRLSSRGSAGRPTF
jgi:hypothetical protein